MANTKISALTSLAAVPASGDLFSIVDISDTTQAASGSTKKIAASFFAFLGQAQTFTTTQTVAPSSTGVEGIVINMPTSTVFQALKINYNGTQRQQAYVDAAGTNRYWLLSGDATTGSGSYVVLGRNSNASTPAAGFVQFENRAGTTYYNWIDASGNARVGTTAPINAQDSSGTVVGAQTSMAAAKNISDVLPDPVESLRNVMKAAKKGLRAWSYKSGSYNNEYFPNGLVTDLADRYGMDRDAEHPHGKSLNIPVAIGDLFASVALIANHLGIETESN